MKQLILHRIYQSFDSWGSHIMSSCHRGCAACCTQDVSMTAIEGENILHFVKHNGMEGWLAEKLSLGLPDHSPSLTTNAFAKACINGDDSDPGVGAFDQVCPFLENGDCCVYDARPFSCRCFVSTKTCQPGSTALIPEYYMTATTAVSQIIEHLGQREHWGNMLHVLYLLAQQPGNRRIGDALNNPQQRTLAQTCCLTGQELPGFLISADDYPLVAPLIESIFDSEIEGKRIEDILNGP